MEVKMDGRFLGLAVVIFIILAILETSADNFYALRYGKRDSQGSERRLFNSPKYHRRSDVSSDLFYGSRYGKRNTTPPKTVPVEVSDRFGRSLESDMPRSNRFYVGSRFGKRGHRSGEAVHEEEEKSESGQDRVVCRYTGFRHLYHCLGELEQEKGVDKVF
ncbi:UNVERIFIED_CONTAM: hypothetical protein PYX00_010569 [Menopon gallinae]|uniref:Uncharacterized protein n=1 Tax=Menopon gallinae TaxID=328185 RepID=A0AAW2HFV2_9NEOP